VAELGPECARWLATGEGLESEPGSPDMAA
jgi:hypothetical protein